MGATPVILSGAHAAFRELWDGFGTFQKKVKDASCNSRGIQVAAKAKAKPVALKRVTDECSSQAKIVVGGILKDMFYKDEATKEELWMSPYEPAALIGGMERFSAVQESSVPTWWSRLARNCPGPPPHGRYHRFEGLVHVHQRRSNLR